MGNLQKIHPRSAGIDVGSAKVFVGLEGKAVRSFRTFTTEFYQLLNSKI